MKIGIITTHWALNYGAVLQSFALEKYLQAQGYDCEIVDFRPQIGKYGRNYIIWNKNIKQWCQNIIKLFKVKNKKLFQEKQRKLSICSPVFPEILAAHRYQFPVYTGNVYT